MRAIPVNGVARDAIVVLDVSILRSARVIKLSRVMLLVAAVLTTTATVRAGLSSASSSEVAASTPGSIRSALLGDIAASDPPGCETEAASSPAGFSECAFGYAGFAGSRRELLFNPYTAALRDEAAGEPSEVQQLPAPPGGASLLLSGLLSLGAFQLGRSARHLHLAALPAWYHEACPERIGHTVAFDFDLADMPVCFLAEIAATDVTANTPAFHEFLRESGSRIESQFVLPVTAPRGPPAIA